MDTALIELSNLPADQNPVLVYLGSLAAGSRRTMKQALDRMAILLTGDDQARAELIPWGRLRFQHTAALRAALMERYAPSTVNKMLSALRGVLRRAWRLGQMTADQYQAAIDLDPVPTTRIDQAAGRALSPGELAALIGGCDDGTLAGARDAAMIALLYACGLRRAEVAALDVDDYDPTLATLTVTGKRNRTRSMPVPGGAEAALLDWLDLRGPWAGPLFVRIPKGGRMTKERLTDQGVYVILHRRAEGAGVDAFSPHDLRRTYAGDLLDAGADLVTVQKLMGHSDPRTTAGYDRRGERVKREAAGRLYVPYKRRR